MPKVYVLPNGEEYTFPDDKVREQEAFLKKYLATTYSPTSYSSTIGADGLNFFVRNGKRCNPIAIVTINS